MQIEIIHEHSIDLSLLPEKANILDAGCRGMEFANYFREKGHNVLAIDIDYLEQCQYMQCGIGPYLGVASVSKNSDLQARKIENLKFHGTIENGEVFIYRIQELENINEGEFDLIKLDVEGEEYMILGTATHPIAKQVSVEFHAHCGQTKEQLDGLLDRLSEWYEIHNRVWEERHGAGFNYWDILLIAK